MSKTSIPFFYHGISRSMILDSTSIKLCGPVSTTSQYTVAVGRFAQNGIVLQISNMQTTNRFLPCSYWSCYSDEYEYLFIGGLAHFELSTIRDIPNQQRYDPLIRAMTVFHFMVDGYALYSKVTKKNIRVIRTLIQEEENNTLLKGLESSVPVYFLSLFHHFLNRLTYVDINLYFMDKETYNNSTRFCFKSLVSVFCLNGNPYSLNYVLLLSLMSNIKSFVIWNTSRYKESVELNQEFVSSMTQAITLETQCQAFHIVNPSIPGSKSLTDFIKEQQEAFNKYGWRLQQETTFKHPRRTKYPACSKTLLIERF
eukprot:743176_1